MMGLFLIVLLAVGLTILMWTPITEVCILCIDTLKKWVMKFKEETETKADLGPAEGGLKGRLYEHIRTVLQITLGMGTDRSIRAFAAVSISLAALSFTLLAGKVTLSLAAAAALGSGLMPYGLLLLRLQNLRVSSSREGEILITELLENYKIEYCNMRQAIETTAAVIEDAPNSKRLLMNLARGLNTAEKSRISSLLREFRLSINTSWGHILTSNMGFALTAGVEVTEALTDLADTVKRARKVNEFARRENNEASLILKYLAPAAYLLTAVGGIRFFGLSAEKFLFYQFRTEAGLTWFTISLIIYVAGVLFNACLSATKLDI